MKLPRDVDAGELIKALAKLGYRPVRQSGSHVRLECREPMHALTVPDHRPLRVGTLAGIVAEVALRQHMDRNELIRLLFG